MNREWSKPLLFAFLLLFSNIGKAAIACSNNDQIMPLDGWEKRCSCSFKIVNNGSSTVRISDVKSDCSCTNVSLSNKSLSPGQSVTCNVIVDVKTTGVIRKKLVVMTDSGEQLCLNLSLIMPETIVFSPNNIVIKKGDGDVDIKINRVGRLIFHGYSVACDDPGIRCKIVHEEGKEIVRMSTANPKPRSGVVRVIADYPKDDPMEWRISFQVL